MALGAWGLVGPFRAVLAPRLGGSAALLEG